MDEQLQTMADTFNRVVASRRLGDHEMAIVRGLQFETDLRGLGVKRSPKWPAARRAHLKKFPACAATGTTEEVEVHHKFPFHEHPELELDPGNFITLTQRQTIHAHFWLGHLGDWKCFNPHVVEDAAMMLDRIRSYRKGSR